MPSILPCRIDADPEHRRRLRYALEMLLHPLGIRPSFPDEVRGDGPSLHYGPDAEGGEGVLSIRSSPATAAFFRRREPLDPTRVRRVDRGGEKWPALFGADVGVHGGDVRADLDPLASAFFWLSGWDEWTRPERDRHGRVCYEGSAACALGVVDRPCVDAYREMMGAWLRDLGCVVRRPTWRGRSWAVCPTHDLDYLGKWSRGVLWREILADPLRGRGRLGSVLRNLVLEEDPYRYSFTRMLDLEIEEGGGATYFLKTAARSPYDAPARTRGREYRRRVERILRAGMEVGLHPGYFGSDDRLAFASQRRRIEELSGVSVRSVRNHYLRWHPVATPRLFEGAGIGIDASLGYAEREGFRRGTCHPFRLYDLEADRALDVWELPLLAMDSTLFGYRGLDAGQALASTRALLEQVRRFRGVAVLLWHPILYDRFDHAGWHVHFEEVLPEIRERGGAVLALRDALDAWLGDRTTTTDQGAP